MTPWKAVRPRSSVVDSRLSAMLSGGVGAGGVRRTVMRGMSWVSRVLRVPQGAPDGHRLAASAVEKR